MKEIYFDNLKLKNVRCYDSLETDFPVSCFEVVVGKNGKGKSTIPKTVNFAIYGNDGEDSKASDMIRRSDAKNMEIIFNFRVDSDRYRIERYYKHSKGDELLFFKNDVDISGETKTATYELIEAVLVPQRIYKNTVYFAQQVKDFFLAVGNTDQKSIFNSILNLSVWEERRENNKTIKEKLNRSINDKTLEFNSCKTSLEEKLRNIQYLENALKEYNEKKEKDILILSFDISENEKKIIYLTSLLNPPELIEPLIMNRDKFLISINETNTLINGCDKLISSLPEEYSQKANELKASFDSELDLIVSKKKIDIRNGNDSLRSTLNLQIQELQDHKIKNDNSRQISIIEFEYNEYEKKANEKLSSIRTKEVSLDKDKMFSESKIESLKNSQIKDIEGRITNHRDSQKSYLQDIRVCENDIDSAQKNIDKNLESLSRPNPSCSKCGQILLQDSKEILRKENSVFQSLIDDRNIKITQLKSLISDEEKKIDILSRDLQKIENEASQEKQKLNNHILSEKNSLQKEENDLIFQIEDKKSEKIKSIDYLKKQNEDMIRVTNLKITEYKTRLSALEKEEEEKLSQIRNSIYLSEVGNLQKKIDDLKILYKNKISEQTKIKQDSESLLIKIQEDQKSNDSKIKQLTDHNKKINDDIATLKELVISKSSELKVLQINNFDDKQLISNRLEVISLRDKSFSISEQLKCENEQLEIACFWDEAFSDRGIKSMLMDDAIPYINSCLHEELEKLVPGKFVVSFDTISFTKSGNAKDQINVRVLNTWNGADNYKLLSGGERRMIDLCCMRALRKLTEKMYDKRFNVVFYDEVLDSLDEENSTIFCQLLQQTNTNQYIQLITHKLLESVEPTRILRV